MRTIGVLGGIGPQATMDFEAMLHEEARAVLTPHLNEGYPPLVTVYLRHPPILVDAGGRPRLPLAVDPRLLDAARRLGQWADLLVITSNTPHLFLDAIRQAAGCEVLSLVDAVFEELERRNARPVGLVGLGVPQVYAERFEREGIDPLVPSEALRRRLDDAILRLMEGRTTDAHREAAREAVADLRRRGASVIVLGCTEIPLLLGPDVEQPDLVNPARLLARAVVRRAME